MGFVYADEKLKRSELASTPLSSVRRPTLTGGTYADQVAALAPVQMQGGRSDVNGIHSLAARGTVGSGAQLPHLEKIQMAFGSHDVSRVETYTGGRAAEANRSMGADAYATGNKIAFRHSPDLHTAAHEAAHIVQQRAGVSLKGGVGVAGDRYESHADRVADAVVKGESAQGLLDQFSGRGAPSKGIQQSPASDYQKLLNKRSLAASWVDHFRNMNGLLADAFSTPALAQTRSGLTKLKNAVIVMDNISKLETLYTGLSALASKSPAKAVQRYLARPNAGNQSAVLNDFGQVLNGIGAFASFVPIAGPAFGMIMSGATRLIGGASRNIHYRNERALWRHGLEFR